MTSRLMTSAAGPQAHVHRGERGASLVEYALLVGVISVVLIAGVKLVGNNSSDSMEGAATAIAAPSGAGGPAPGGDGGGGGGGGGAGTTTPTSAAPTPTTSAAPTPTTAPPAPTTAPAPTATSGSVGIGDVEVVKSGSNWTAETTVSIVDDTGQPVVGATVDLTVRYRERGWLGYTWHEESVQVETGPDGTADIGAGPYKRGSGIGSVGQIEFVVKSAALPDDLAWDQNVQTAGATAP
jgi:Flp pilus assembly pilin Flp